MVEKKSPRAAPVQTGEGVLTADLSASVERPEVLTEAQLATEFVSGANRIRAEYAERKNRQARNKARATSRLRSGKKRLKTLEREPPNAWLRRTAYGYLKRYIALREESVFAEIVANAPRRTAGQHDIKDQPFKMGLLALFPSSGGPTRKQRSDWGDQMQYAFNHGVPRRYFVAFTMAAGSPSSIRKKLKANRLLREFGDKPYDYGFDDEADAAVSS
ncbi:MAG: hypothetical protein JWQ16_900 [Novosphingobium sp.]|nr:hypothetical protein [Novosphingobium sp.]